MSFSELATGAASEMDAAELDAREAACEAAAELAEEEGHERRFAARDLAEGGAFWQHFDLLEEFVPSIFNFNSIHG